MNQQGAPRRCARRFQPRLLPNVEPLFVSEVNGGLDAGLVNHLRPVITQIALSQNLLVSAVGNFIVS